MIIKLIIKHLLPTAPALSLSSGHPPPPGTLTHREREREGALEKEGGTQEELEGGVGERRAANPKGSSSHCWILSHRREAVFLCGGRQRVKLCDPRTKETRRKEQSDAEEELKGLSKGAPPTQPDINTQLIKNAWFLLVNFSIQSSDEYSVWSHLWIQKTLRLFLTPRGPSDRLTLSF